MAASVCGAHACHHLSSREAKEEQDCSPIADRQPDACQEAGCTGSVNAKPRSGGRPRVLGWRDVVGRLML